MFRNSWDREMLFRTLSSQHHLWALMESSIIQIWLYLLVLVQAFLISDRFSKFLSSTMMFCFCVKIWHVGTLSTYNPQLNCAVMCYHCQLPNPQIWMINFLCQHIHSGTGPKLHLKIISYAEWMTKNISMSKGVQKLSKNLTYSLSYSKHKHAYFWKIIWLL